MDHQEKDPWVINDSNIDNNNNDDDMHVLVLLLFAYY